MNTSNPVFLIVDDEPPIRRFLRAGLSGEDYKIIEASSGNEAIQHTATHNPSVMLLDLGLPDIDGIEVVRRVREWSDMPIIVLSAREKDEDKIHALDSGANDYLVKPFSMGELKARIRVALRQRASTNAERENAVLQTGNLTIDFGARRVLRGTQEIHLTPTEFRLLGMLCMHMGKVLTHAQLLTEVWGKAFSNETQYLRVFMKQLRQKLEEEPSRPRHITTETGIGYRFRE